MRSKPPYAISAIASFGIVMTFLLAGEARGMQTSSGKQTDATRQSYDVEMTDSENRLQALMTQLKLSLMPISDASKAAGQAVNQSLVDAHQKNIDALQNAAIRYKLFAIPSGHQCGPNSPQHAMTIRHQARMQAALSDLANTFTVYARDNGPSHSPTAEKALKAHRRALQKMEMVVTEHADILTQLKNCPV